ncbi:hypothetical protein VN12_06290 [Pirellula sp. SH-Sr6A]|nr:hypothetical protein VN12_06290 [Pirellula sp. SH-Sr6A]
MKSQPRGVLGYRSSEYYPAAASGPWDQACPHAGVGPISAGHAGDPYGNNRLL